jgi:hypothetical protein
MQQEHDKRQLCLQAEHSEQLKRTQLQAENELREVEYTHTHKITTELWFVYNFTSAADSPIPCLHVENNVYEEWPWSSD